jgi:hypothetical protein
MRHTGGLLRRAVSMIVQLETYGLEARFWTARRSPEARGRRSLCRQVG